ncbi:hypothetical protein VTK26DRAFT_8489 [Humicola hyalothermophila]
MIWALWGSREGWMGCNDGIIFTDGNICLGLSISATVLVRFFLASFLSPDSGCWNMLPHIDEMEFIMWESSCYDCYSWVGWDRGGGIFPFRMTCCVLFTLLWLSSLHDFGWRRSDGFRVLESRAPSVSSLCLTMRGWVWMERVSCTFFSLGTDGNTVPPGRAWAWWKGPQQPYSNMFSREVKVFMVA